MIYEIYNTQTLLLSHLVKAKSEAYMRTFQTLGSTVGSCSNRQVRSELFHRNPDTLERPKQNAKPVPMIQPSCGKIRTSANCDQ